MHFSKEGARQLRDEVVGKDTNTKGDKMASQLLDQFNQLHSIEGLWPDKEIETVLLKQFEHEVDLLGKKPTYPRNLVKFNPSGASKCVEELYQKAIGQAEPLDLYPYHRRWTRNSTAIHTATQRDLLYTEKYVKNPKFTVERTESGLPAWEDNILKWEILEHHGAQFVLNGKMDGILRYEDGTRVGFEFKTKSNSVGQVGHYKMKESAPYHVDQCVAYFLLFGIRDYIIMYEGVAKDQWSKGVEAKPDIRAFHYYITDEMAEALLDKWAGVAKAVEAKVPPVDSTCDSMFCPVHGKK